MLGGEGGGPPSLKRVQHYLSSNPPKGHILLSSRQALRPKPYTSQSRLVSPRIWLRISICPCIHLALRIAQIFEDGNASCLGPQLADFGGGLKVQGEQHMSHSENPLTGII